MEATNGYAKGSKMNGHAPGTKRRTARKGPSLLGWTLSLAARLFTWYAIVTIFFRCPATLDLCDESSPRLCKTYFQAKEAVSPHVEPYYDTYAAPYVELAKPYYDIASERVISPASSYVAKYGGPALHHAQAYGQAQWDKTIQPQITEYQQTAKDNYDSHVAPHVAHVSAVVGPYWEISRGSALQTYHEILLPSYQLAQPYLAQAYDVTSTFTTETAVPTACWAWNKTAVFLDTTVWPQLRVLYVENVEPQLARIGQRLGRYKDKSKASVENAADSVTADEAPEEPSSSDAAPSQGDVGRNGGGIKVKPKPKSSTTPAAKPSDDPQAPNPADAAEQDESGQVAAPPASENESDTRKTARETVAQDLKDWQNKFASAAEEGAEEIEESIARIVKDIVAKSAHATGNSHVKALEDTIESEIAVLKEAISGIVRDGGDDAGDDLIAAVRKAGFAVKQKAQAIRDWKSEFEGEMETAITNAAENHFMILNGIRDLAMQKIGMKWAWMDGVTYKDWAKYHELRDKFDEWTKDLKQLIVTHPALDYARAESGEVEDKGMAVAQEAAQELTRLKDVAFWKMAAADSSDNFDSDAMREAADAAEKLKIQAAEAAAEAARAAEEQSQDEPVPDSNDDAAPEDAQGVSETEDDPLEEAANVVGESPAIEVSEEVDGGVSESEEKPLESTGGVNNEEPPIDNVAGEEPTDSDARVVVDEAADDPEGAAPGSESIDSSINEDTSVAADTEDEADDSSPDLASTVLLDDQQQHTFVADDSSAVADYADAEQPESMEEKAEEQLEEQLEEEIISESADDSPVNAETDTVKPAFLGAMAQKVPDRGGPILDDAEEDPETFVERAQDSYNNAVAQAASRYSIAVSAVSAKIHGTPEPEPVQQEMFAAISSRYAAATDLANSRFHQAVDAASKGVYGAPTPVPTPSHDWSRVEALAADRLHEGRIWAEEQYEAAKVALGLATATPTATNEKLLEQARGQYYAGLGVAHARYSEFLDAAASALNSFTARQTPTDAAGTASSVASEATETAAAVASGAADEGHAVASAVGEGVNAAASIVGEAVDAAAQEVLDAAEAVERGVADTWDKVINHVSAQVYGAPTPTAVPEGWYGKAYDDVEKYAARASSEAAKQYEVVYSIVQELIVGKEPSASESILGRLQSAYNMGASSAAAYLEQATGEAAKENAGKDEL